MSTLSEPEVLATSRWAVLVKCVMNSVKKISFLMLFDPLIPCAGRATAYLYGLQVRHCVFVGNMFCISFTHNLGTADTVL